MSVYFEGLNYGLANEDTTIEFNLMPENAQSVFTVCGSGSRVIPLLAKNPKELHVVDLSPVQIALLRLRLAAIKNLSYEEFLFLLGYKKELGLKKRSELLQRLGLSNDDLKLWKGQEEKWEDKGFIYLGRWENHFMKLGKIFEKATFANLRPIFEAKSLEEQKQIIQRYFHPRVFKLFTKILLNEYVFNKFLYKGHFAGGKDKKTTDLTAAELVYNEFTDLFANTWVRSNYFLNMIFLNEVSFPESYPIECNQDIFDKVKKGETKIVEHVDNLLNVVHNQAHDFYSLSDTFSYMSDSEVKNFFGLMPQDVPLETLVVIRTFMRTPHLEVTTPWSNMLELNKKLAKEDCTRMYEFSVIKKTLMK